MTLLPQFVEPARKFGKMFSPYFPRLSNDIDAAATEMEWLEIRVFGNPLDTTRRTEAKRNLLRLCATIRSLAQWDDSYWVALGGMIFDAERKGGSGAKEAKRIFEILIELGLMQGNGALDGAIRTFRREAEKAIKMTPDKRNVNWEAVHAVDVLRRFWRRNTGRAGPSRALNPASTFADYLRTGFQYLGIEADPRSAFRRWSQCGLYEIEK